MGLAIATVIMIFFTYRHGKHLARNQENLVIAQTALVEEQKKQVENHQHLIDLEGQQQKFSSLIQIFQLLDDNKHRNARRRIINLYTDGSNKQRWGTLKYMNGVQKDAEYNENFVESNYRESREIVKADFNLIGTLIKSELVEKEKFLQSYWLEVLKCYITLDGFSDEVAPENFTYLKEEAEKYRQQNHKILESPITMSKEDFNSKFRDVKEVGLTRSTNDHSSE